MAKNKKTPPVPRTQRAIYPGTFDPITLGHLDLIKRSLAVFDELTVVVAQSGKKKPLFDAATRKKLIEDSLDGDTRVKVETYDGLLVDYAKKKQIKVILRGLRAVSDFEYEFQMATINRRMFSELQTFFLMASEKFFFVNSTLVKEVFSHGGDVSELVPANVLKKLQETV